MFIWVSKKKNRNKSYTNLYNKGHGFWILKMYKGVKNCVAEIKDTF